MRCPTCLPQAGWVIVLAVFPLIGVAARCDEPDYLSKIKALGLPHLEGKVMAYYSPGPGHREHAEQLQHAIQDMNAFYQERLHVQTKAALALVDSKDWTRITGDPYGLPMDSGSPPVIFMPATSDSPAHGLMAARKQAIPPEALAKFLQENHTTFEAVADEFVDLIGFHELGHELTGSLGIDPKNRWLSEFLASYWSYAYIAERRPEWKSAYALLGRPSAQRPRNTSLEDFERLYNEVDDYGWYQGMFEVRIQEIYPQAGLTLLTALKKEFPLAQGDAPGYTLPLDKRMKPQELLDRLDKIEPGFKQWGANFVSAP